MMTKFWVFASVFLVSMIMIFAGMHIQDIARAKQDENNIIHAKRDDLILQQQRLETMIDRINQTLENEMAKQERLSDELSNVASTQQALAERLSGIKTVPVATVEPELTPQPARPAPVRPAPRPVTRAS